MRETTVTTRLEGLTLSHELVPATAERRGTGVILLPTVMGVSPLELGFARDLAGLGYGAMVADLYGRRFTSEERSQAVEAMNALKADRGSLRDRLLAVLATAREAMGLRDTRLAAAGYCFGGLCALDLARSGAAIAGVASFHGLFDPPDWPTQPIRARVIAFHGWDDPLAPPDKVEALAAELTKAGADWQIHAFGNTQHGFTNPGATGAIPGVRHQPQAAARSWRGLVDFLDELFG